MGIDLNTSTRVGYIHNQPELKYTKNDRAFVTFSAASSDDYKDKEDQYVNRSYWFNYIIWGPSAEAFVNKVSVIFDDNEGKKNKFRVLLSGKDTVETWDDANSGEKRNRNVTVVNSWTIFEQVRTPSTQSYEDI